MRRRRSSFAPRHRPWRGVLAAVLALLAAAGGYLWWLGYLGGPVYRIVAATAAPPPAERGTVAVLFSGDMGFETGMAPKIAARIARAGIPVVGVNSLTAFARRRSPAETGVLVNDATRRALALPGARRVVLIGQSFGANALLQGIDALPPGVRARVPIVELVVPADTMLLRATPGGVFDTGQDGPAAPYARRLDWVPVLCVHGLVEPHSLCTEWRQRNVMRIALPGGHYLNHDAALVSADLLRAITGRIES